MKGFAIEGRSMSNKHKPQLSQLPLDLSIYSTKNDILGFWPLLRLRQTIESLSVKWSNNRFERCFHITIHWRDASKFTATIGGNLFTHFFSSSSFFPETISPFLFLCFCPTKNNNPCKRRMLHSIKDNFAYFSFHTLTVKWSFAGIYCSKYELYDELFEQ